LDLGCGQGVLARKLSQKNMRVMGVDASPKLIEFAKQRDPENTVNFQVRDAAKLQGIPDKSFDVVTCVLALQNMEHPADVFQEIGRVLKPGGKVLLVLNHHCFRIPRQTGWGFDEQRKLQYRRVDSYLSPNKIPIQMQPGAAPELHTWTFHRPLSDYINWLGANHMATVRMEELASHRQSLPGPQKKTEDRSRQEIPLFMVIMARKNG